MRDNFTIVTAVTPEYKSLLYWSMATWVFKPQLRNRPLIVFYSGMRQRDLKFVYKLYPNAELIEWSIDGIEKREMVFSSFVFGAAKFVKTKYYMKLDADSYCTTDEDVWNEKDFEYDIIGHKWGYTKPGWFIDALENYYSGCNITLNKDENKRSHKRFESYCCLHRTDWVRGIVPKLNGRLPVPSHDTTLWFYADKEGKWGRKNIKSVGVHTTSSWKKIREEMCKGDIAFNPLLNEELLSHVQLEITSRCNLACTQCDRNCGVVPAGIDMSIPQIWSFVEQSLSLKRQWKRIDIIGGEPTLHKDLKVIFDLVKIYKNKYPRCKVRLSSNGHGQHVENVLKTVPEWVIVRNSSKEDKNQPHDAYRCAPVDMGEVDVYACSVPWRCGIGLTKHGYFPCGAGASLAKVFGLDIGIKNLVDVTPESLKKQMVKLCKYCGHSSCNSRKTVANDNEMSDSWKNAVKYYNPDSMNLI